MECKIHRDIQFVYIRNDRQHNIMLSKIPLKMFWIAVNTRNSIKKNSFLCNNHNMIIIIEKKKNIKYISCLNCIEYN